MGMYEAGRCTGRNGSEAGLGLDPSLAARLAGVPEDRLHRSGVCRHGGRSGPGLASPSASSFSPKWSGTVTGRQASQLWSCMEQLAGV